MRPTDGVRGAFSRFGIRRAIPAALFVGAMALCAVPAVASGTIIYVKASATGANDGTSWTDAYTKLQDALGTASSGSQIWVAEGVYYPDEGVGHSNNGADERFNMKSGVALYGGFAGTEGDLGARDWKTHKSILSGDIQQDDVNADGNRIDETWADIVGTNTDSVVLAEGLTSTARLDGFTVTGGYTYNYGGAVYVDNGSGPQFYNLDVRGNWARFYGGGMYVIYDSPHLENVLFEGNSTDTGSTLCYGGGLMLQSSAVTLVNAKFRNNHSNMGGGIGAWPGTLTVDGALFEQNAASNYGGAVTMWDGNTSTFSHVTFNANSAGQGGGIYCFRNNFTVTMTDATFTGNSGTALRFYSANLNLTDATIAGNSGAWGGGLSYQNSTVNVTNADFRGNYGSEGAGAVYGDYNAHATITDSSFNGNYSNIGWGGGAIYSCSADGGQPNSLTLANCILWGDGAPSGGGTKELLVYADYGYGYICSSTASITYCDIWLPSGVYSGTGNTNADPLYVSPIATPGQTTTGDLHLQPTSPAIDAGNNAAVTQLLDRDCQPRRMDVPTVPDTGSGTAPILDMGAYEYPGNPPAVGDLMVTKGDSDADGLDDAHLDWGAITGAVRYLVLRSESANKGFSQILEVTGTEAFDVNVLASPSTYYYSVVPLGY